MIDSVFSGVGDAGMVVWACLMTLWTAIQVLLNLVQPEEK
jgi:hypothetical protein